MNDKFAEMLAVGGHANSLGKVNEVIEVVLQDKSRLDELYACMFDGDAWVRMRAADAIEKICRQRPEWIVPYVDRFQAELSTSAQASIQWHLAQIYEQVDLSPQQKQLAMGWLKKLLSTKEVDWIVSANAMDALTKFTKEGFFPPKDMISLLKVQQGHKSNAVIKRANKLLGEFTA